MKTRTGAVTLLIMLALVPGTALGQQPSENAQRKYDYFFLEATSLKALEKYDAAFDLYKHCLEIKPDAASALYEIGQLYFYLNQVEKGEQALEKAVANEPDNYWYRKTLADFYRQQKKTDKAIELLEETYTSSTNKSETLMALTDLYEQKKDFKMEINTLDRLEDLIGKNEQITMEKFRIYSRLNDNQSAFREIEGLVKEYPYDMRYLAILGDTYMQQGKMDEAYKTFQEVLKNEPGNVAALLSMANYYSQTGRDQDYDKQLEHILLNKDITSDVKLDVMKHVIGKAEASQQDSTYVIGLFDKMIDQDKDDTQIPMLYAQYLMSKNMEKQSEPVLEHILQLDPSNTAARMTLLGSAIRKNDADMVIRIAEPGVEISPDNIEFPFYLGMAYYQKDRYDDAIKIYEHSLKVMPQDANPEGVSQIYGILGDLYYTKNRMKDAYAAYDSALVYNADNISVLNNYAYYLSLEKRNLDKAEEMSHKTVKAEPANATYLDTYAWVLFVKGNYAEARIFIDNALKNKESDSNVVMEHAGDIYYMSGDTEGALKFWQQAQDMGNQSKILKDKIRKKKYIPEK